MRYSNTPLLQHSITPTLHYSNTPLLQHSILLDRQQDAEGGPFADAAFNLNFNVVRLDNHLALEHADAEAALLRGLKRAEEGVAHKLRGHSATVVGHGQGRPATPPARFDPDLAARAEGVPGVE